MRISIFSATGMAETSIVAEALGRGHTVTAWSHRLGTFPRHERLTAAIIDLSTPSTLGPVLGKADAAVLTIHPNPGDEHQLAPWTAGFLDAAATTKTRVLILGTAAPFISASHPGLLIAEDPANEPAEQNADAQASIDQLRVCLNHPYRRWVYLSPGAVLEPVPQTGSYERRTAWLRFGSKECPQITLGDIAITAIDELENAGRNPHFTTTHASSRACLVNGGPASERRQ